MTTVETNSTIYQLEGDLLISTLKANHTMDISDVKENYEARQTLNMSYPMLFLMDLRHLEDMDFKAIIATGEQPDSQLAVASAMVLSKTVHKVIALEAKKFRTFKTPVKAFEDYDEAMEWLLSHRTP